MLHEMCVLYISLVSIRFGPMQHGVWGIMREECGNKEKFL